MAREEELAAAYRSLRARLAAVAMEAGRAAQDVTVVAVTKFFPAADVLALAAAGCGDVGESRDQEASAKVADVAGITAGPLRWHMVGSVQRNKARSVARWAHTVHSVDSTRLSAALDRAARAALADGTRPGPLRAFVQISLDGDVSRGGVDIGDRGAVDAVCDAVAGADGLVFAGLMGVAPRGAQPDAAFAALQDERNRVVLRHPGAVELSAGMSGDVESAVRHGATVVRVGTALLGPRPLPSPPAVTSVTSSSPPDVRPPSSKGPR